MSNHRLQMRTSAPSDVAFPARACAPPARAMDAALHASARHGAASLVAGGAASNGAPACLECLAYALCAEPLAAKRELFVRCAAPRRVSARFHFQALTQSALACFVAPSAQQRGPRALRRRRRADVAPRGRAGAGTGAGSRRSRRGGSARRRLACRSVGARGCARRRLRTAARRAVGRPGAPRCGCAVRRRSRGRPPRRAGTRAGAGSAKRAARYRS